MDKFPFIHVIAILILILDFKLKGGMIITACSQIFSACHLFYAVLKDS